MNEAKIHSALLDEITSITANSAEGGSRSLEEPPEQELKIIVCYQQNRPSDEFSIMSAPPEPDIQIERRLERLSAVAGSATPTQIKNLSQSDGIEMIWLDQKVEIALDYTVPFIKVPQIWRSGYTGAGVKICIIDTGIDPNHPDFAGRIAQAQDFTGEGPVDGNGHGTHVASVAAGNGKASNGKYRGVAPDATILSAKVLRSDGSGRMSYVMAGIEWALDEGANIINLSLGAKGNCDGTDATSTACNEAIRLGAIVIAAAGNEGPNDHTVGSPGCADLVITVGASTDEDKIARFSSRGPTKDGRVKPDVVLPGAGVIAARARGTHLGEAIDDFYTSVNGTSMAAPHASGIAALMLEANPNLTHEEIKAIFTQAVLPINGNPNSQGKGRLLAERAIELAIEARPEPEPEPEPEPVPEPERPNKATKTDPLLNNDVSQTREGCFAPVMKVLGFVASYMA